MFDLSVVDEGASATDSDRTSAFEKLAASARVDVDLLKAQWADVLPRALHFYRARSMASRDAVRDAWRAAVEHCEKVRAGAQLTMELRKTLATYFAMSVSTSGVEQKFSQGHHRVHDRIAADPATEELALKVMLDAGCYETRRITALARRAWAVCFRKSRSRPAGSARCDKGVKRIWRGGAPARVSKSEAEFVRKRRKADRKSVV